ncbi:BTAD domain-containing putative transcriptional regulator [Saccharothrix violaceirubra]|uniref:DNA-binding SARP family transcriptional activator/tetratricopeptide (TPR) repeat protein n=1 Tax=Saccharothrix violaceirubra TaxID=413306 RepID=A0A7W7T953_9PSEU|nr:AfsR/SARP family transcriptional regulator [Saccharothrix violaceirubra]MBB4968829.1 DNA-binding SARP family transcriptional activator/tetratricopeptide (TPR) repeat protein [Saccharothrix violaceirubra]
MAEGRSGLEFGVLGPLQVLADGKPLPIGRKGMRGLLAMLVLDANRVVPIDGIVDCLWADDPPATARTIVHGYVSRLRRMLEEADPAGSARILTTPPGYQLLVDPWRLDFHRARQLVSSARGKPAPIRAQLLRESLGLWRGPVLGDVPGRPATTDLEELRLAALEERVEAELELGRHLELVGELRRLVDEYPFRERLVAHSMRALYRSGQRADALDAYQRFHRRVVDELGIDPGPELRVLHEQVLRDDPALGGEGDIAPVALVPPRAGVVVPALLPAAASGFIGRDDELARLDLLCAQRDLQATTIAVVAGAPGIGKSELVVTWGHRRAEWFPDGLLYASLNGFVPDRDPVEPGEVLGRFLHALGVPADGLPRDLDDRVGLYRSVLAKRRVLVVLDDAWDPEHVRLLLPPGAGSVVLVTSRRRLESLVVSNGARMLTLDTLREEESVRLVDSVVGKPVSEQEPTAVRMLVELCGNLPLALRIAAAKLVLSPEWTVEDLVVRLSHDDHRLRTLDLPETGVGVARALAVSYRNLPPELAETFRAAGLVPGRWVSPHAIAAVCGTDLGTAQNRLADLADAHLVVEQWRGGYVLHDLVRLYAREVVGPAGPDLRRLVDHYLAACDHARRLIRPVADGLDFSGGDTPAARPATAGQALSWFDKEWPNLIALVHAGAEAGLHRQVWQLVRLVHTYCVTRPAGREWQAIAEFGLASARIAADRRGEMLVLHAMHEVDKRAGSSRGRLADARRAYAIAADLGEPRYLVMALDQLACALTAEDRDKEALACYREAVEVARGDGDALGEATVLDDLAQAERKLGRLEKAARHQFEAMEVHHRNGDERAFVVAVNNLAGLYADLGLLAEAEENARQGVELARGGAMRFEEAFGRLVLGGVLARRGEVVAAQAELAESLRLFERLGSARARQVRSALEALDR